MSVHEQKPKEKKGHPILIGVVIFVLGSTIMLFVTTLYNLFLAHIWPVTIHFGDYSLANVVYIMVSVLTSLVVAFLAFYLGFFYLVYLIGTILGGLLGLLLPPEQRAARKRSWRERTIDRLGFFFMLPFNVITKWQIRRNPPVRIDSGLREKLRQTQSKSEENQQPQ